MLPMNNNNYNYIVLGTYKLNRDTVTVVRKVDPELMERIMYLEAYMGYKKLTQSIEPIKQESIPLEMQIETYTPKEAKQAIEAIDMVLKEKESNPTPDAQPWWGWGWGWLSWLSSLVSNLRNYSTESLLSMREALVKKAAG
jgi:hypothetical protein